MYQLPQLYERPSADESTEILVNDSASGDDEAIGDDGFEIVNPADYSNISPEDVTESEEMIIQRAREAYLKHLQMQGKSYDDDDDDDDDDEEENEDSEGSASGDFRNEDDRTVFNTYRRANNAIKFMETPHGKVGILYDTDQRRNTEELQEDANREEKPRGKITPVLTPDGKVALLYRGAASETAINKYEPLTNVSDNKWPQVGETTSQSNAIITTDVKTTTPMPPAEILDEYDDEDEDNDEENFILPSINRPLSEVLGIKKNQFTQFRITEATTPMPRSAVTFKKAVLTTTPPQDYDYGSENDVRESNEIDPEIDLSKTEVVNLAIIPSFAHDIDQYGLERHDREKHYHGHRRNRAGELSGIHCAMQAMVAAAALACFFGMIGAYFKTRILDQITLIHW
ncbi:hypothetical protein DMENIID0001_108540 [Sergentomyia squamirostris]